MRSARQRQRRPPWFPAFAAYFAYASFVAEAIKDMTKTKKATDGRAQPSLHRGNCHKHVTFGRDPALFLRKRWTCTRKSRLHCHDTCPPCYMKQLPNIKRSLRTHRALLQGFLSLVLMAFPLSRAWAATLIDDYVPELQLVGGDAKAYLRNTFPDGSNPNQNKAVALLFSQLQPYSGTLLASDPIMFDGWPEAYVTTIVAQSNVTGNRFFISRSSSSNSIGIRESEYVDRLQFLIPATVQRPFGTRVMVRVTGNGSIGGAAFSSGSAVGEGQVSPVDGRKPSFIIRFAGQSLDLSSTPFTIESYGVVQTGVPFLVESDFLATNTNGKGVSCNIDLRAIAEPNQTITFPPIETKGMESIPLVATASSGLPVEFSVVSGPATIAGNILTPTDKGTVVIRASQPGNSEFTAAIALQQTIDFADKVAVVKMLRGTATVYRDGRTVGLKLGDWLRSGQTVTTGNKSFVRLVFIDKSLMNIGPKSEMLIERFGEGDASIIDLVKGQIRSKVSEDYLQQKDKTKPKMFLKTPNAVTGIRGTEFDLSYTIRNGIGTTSIQMIEGLVEMEDLTTGKITMLKDQDRLQVQAPAIVPELALFDRSGKRLARGATAPHFGIVVSRASKLARFEIRNLGIADLTDIKPVITGRHARDFRIIKQPKSSLEPEEKSAFTIRFSPRSAGPRTAILQIASSDPEGKPFEVILKGDGVVAAPKLVVEWPAGSQVSNGDSRKLGSAVVGLGGSTRTVTLRNTGVKPLTGIRATMVGSHPGDFVVGKVPSSIAPGKKATFDVTFKPKELGPRSAVMEIRSNDRSASVFLIQVNGVGGVLK